MRFLAVLATATALAAPVQAGDAPRAIAEDFGAKWVAAYNANRPDDIAALFAPDGLYNTSGAAIRKPSEIGKAIASRIGQGWTREEVSVEEAHSIGENVWATGRHILYGSGPNSGKQMHGRWGEVLGQSDGKWHIIVLTPNMAPGTTPP